LTTSASIRSMACTFLKSTLPLDNSKLLTSLVRSNRLIVLLIVPRCLILVAVVIIVLVTVVISLVLSIIFVFIISVFVDDILLWIQVVFAVLVLRLVDTFAINIKHPSDMTKDLLHLLVRFLLGRRASLVQEVT